MTVLVTKLFDKGRLVEEQMIRLLKKFDKRISDLEGDEGSLGTRVKAVEDAIGDEETADTILYKLKDLEAVEDAIGDEETADTILYRLKALEDKQEPSNP